MGVSYLNRLSVGVSYVTEHWRSQKIFRVNDGDGGGGGRLARGVSRNFFGRWGADLTRGAVQAVLLSASTNCSYLHLIN